MVHSKKSKTESTSNDKTNSSVTTFVAFCIVSIFFVVGMAFYTFGEAFFESDSTASSTSQTIETTSDGKQILNLTAKGGYSPRTQIAKADTPAVLKINTKNTFDCSTAIRISSIGFSKNLPGTGVTEVQIPPQPAGTVLKGSCSMGMYNFTIKFS